MTNRVRIEKASVSGIYVMVQEQQVDTNGKWINIGNPKPLINPADMFEDYIHQNKRLIVYEIPLGNA